MVAVLLALILRAAREVRAGVSTIWTIGQQVANNTIHIALLDTTNHIAGEILASAKGIVAATAAMGAHAAHCPRVSGLCARHGADAMNAMVLLALISVVGAGALFVALALFLRAIDSELETIGGPATRFKAPANFLAKIRLGVRAIERQTDALAPQVTRLNGGLNAVRDGLWVIDGNLAMLIASVSKQAGR